MKTKDIALKIKGLSKADFEQLKKELGDGYSITSSDEIPSDELPPAEPTPGTGDNGNDTHPPKPPVP